MSGIVARLISAFVLSRFGSQKMVTFLARPIKEDLTVMRELMATGTVTPVIKSDAPEARTKTVSLVLVSPSMLMRLKLASAASSSIS